MNGLKALFCIIAIYHSCAFVESAPLDWSVLIPSNVNSILQILLKKQPKPTGYLGNNGVLNIPRLSEYNRNKCTKIVVNELYNIVIVFRFVATSAECKAVDGYCFY